MNFSGGCHGHWIAGMNFLVVLLEGIQGGNCVVGMKLAISYNLVCLYVVLSPCSLGGILLEFF